MKRIRCAEFGLLYFRNRDFNIKDTLKINGKYHRFNFINKATREFNYEFTETVINDCYRLRELRKILKKVTSIVDIGANQGLFSIAARQQFPDASLYCYEPNRQLDYLLSQNAKNLDALVYSEAVTKDDCKVTLEFGETDLVTRTTHTANGQITGTSLRKVIERAGGQIDLLKLDCEGAEWELFEDENSWQNINCVTMEYHLWAKEGSTLNDIEQVMEKLNFRILSVVKLTATFGMLTAIKTKRK